MFSLLADYSYFGNSRIARGLCCLLRSTNQIKWHLSPQTSTQSQLIRTSEPCSGFCSQPEEEEEEEGAEKEEAPAEANEGEEGGEEETETVELPPLPEHQNLLVAHRMLAAVLISEEEYLALKEIVRARQSSVYGVDADVGMC